MPKRRAITPNVKLTTTFPPELRARLDLFLYSELEQRVPQGAYQAFLVARTIEFFSEKSIDLFRFGIVGKVRGPVETLSALLKLLETVWDETANTSSARGADTTVPSLDRESNGS